MTRFAVRYDIENHQSFFCYGGLHARGFAHDGYADGGQSGQDEADAIFARHLFFGRSQIYKVIATWLVEHDAISLEQ